MSFISNIGFRDGVHLDAFGRVRTSNPTGLFSSNFQYNKQPVRFEEYVVGTGVATHLPNESSVLLSTGGTANAAEATLQSRKYLRYQPGKSQLLMMTFVMGTSVTNCLKEVGISDGKNGVFFRDNGGTLQVVKRSYVTGATVDTEYNQSVWTKDTLDGSGASGITLDITKAQIFWVDLEWLGAGRVRCGFVIDGQLVEAHHIHAANELSAVYMTTANLPVRWTVVNSGVAGGTGTMRAICSYLASEGGENEDGFGHSIMGSSAVTVGAGSDTVIAVIRPKLTFNSIENRQDFHLVSIDILASGDIIWKIWWNPTVSGGTWADVDATYSGMEYQSTLGTITGGIKIESGYVGSATGGRQTLSKEIAHRYPVTIDKAAAASFPVVLTANSIAGSINVRGGFVWTEVR